jgi:hypothetical protein
MLEQLLEYSFKKNCKINHCGLSDLQLVPCGIKMKSKVLEVCQKKNNLLPTVIFHPLN